MKEVFGFTRFLVILGVISSLLLAIVLFVVSLLDALGVIVELARAIGQRDSARAAAIDAIQVADEILIAAALYIIAVGLYELFIGKANLPEWLTVRSFDELKDRLLGVAAAVLAVTFVELVAVSEHGEGLLEPGLAIAAVMIAIGAFSYLYHRAKDNGHSS
jgi:uncharacterized membrane protein YqhA